LEAALASTAENGSSAAELGSAGVVSAVSPRYVDFREAIHTEMFSIKQKMSDLKALHGKAALTSFDDSNSHDMDIEVLTQEITRLFRKVEVRLQQSASGYSSSEADEKVLPHNDLHCCIFRVMSANLHALLSSCSHVMRVDCQLHVHLLCWVMSTTITSSAGLSISTAASWSERLDLGVQTSCTLP